MTMRAVQQTGKKLLLPRLPASILVPSYINWWNWRKMSGLTLWQFKVKSLIIPEKRRDSAEGKADVPHLLVSGWTSEKICSSSLEVSYSFSISYSSQGRAHFWACSICSGVKAKSKRIPRMLNMGRSHRLDHGFGRILTFIWWTVRNSQACDV